MILLVKTRQGDHHAFDNIEKAGDFMCEYPEDIVRADTYYSTIEYIRDEYIHNDLCMPELLRSLAQEIKLTAEDVLVSLAWAGDEDIDVNSILGEE